MITAPFQFTRFRHRESEPGGLSHSAVGCIREDPTGRLWIGTRASGLNAHVE